MADVPWLGGGGAHAVTISLPNTPTGEQYEDCVAGTLRALGYFIETRVILREDKKEVLELDIIATPLGAGSQHREMYEAKKDGISFVNLFKLFGQRIYLGVNTACLVSLKDADPGYRPAYDAKGMELGIRVCSHPIDTSHAGSLAPIRNGLDATQIEAAASVACYLQIAKRLALASMNRRCATEKANPYFEEVRRYNFDVNASFFRKTALERAEALYDAYKQRPRLTGEGVSILAREKQISEQTIWDQIQGSHEHPWLQHLMLLEGTARIAIVKNALDDLLERGEDEFPTASLKLAGRTISFRGMTCRSGLSMDSSSFGSTRILVSFRIFISPFLSSLADSCSSRMSESSLSSRHSRVSRGPK